jgi:hypothetical protein
MSPRGLTLARSLTLALSATALTVALLMTLLLRRWGDSLLEASALLRESASRNAETVVLHTLGGAEAAVASLEKQVASATLPADDPLAVERALFTQLLANQDLEEATFTRGNEESTTGHGRTWQVSVYRAGRPPLALVTSLTRRGGRGYVVELRERPAGATGLLAAPFLREPGPAPDPTAHLTFTSTLEHHRFSDAPLWTDLHYAERDEALPEADRRVVATVMKAVEDGAGNVVGVVRVGLLADRLDQVASRAACSPASDRASGSKTSTETCAPRPAACRTICAPRSRSPRCGKSRPSSRGQPAGSTSPAARTCCPRP